MTSYIKTIALTAALTTFATASSAMNCAPRDSVVERLSSKFSEVMNARGFQQARSGGVVVEVWVSETNGTFTILMTSATGISCVVASGTHWFPQDDMNVASMPKGTLN